VGRHPVLDPGEDRRDVLGLADAAADVFDEER
jgi:hypothetical protein